MGSSPWGRAALRPKKNSCSPLRHLGSTPPVPPPFRSKASWASPDLFKRTSPPAVAGGCEALGWSWGGAGIVSLGAWNNFRGAAALIVRVISTKMQSRSNGVSSHSSEPLPILHWCRRWHFFVATLVVILVEDFQQELFGGDGASA